MPWSTALLSALAAPAARLRLSLAKIPDSWGPGTSAGAATSDPRTGVGGISTDAAIAMSSQSVSVPRWTTNRGTARVGLGSIAAGHWVAQNMPRGSLVQIGGRVAGMATADRLFVGQLRDLEGVGPRTIVSAWDILASLGTQTGWFAGLDSGALFYHCDPDSINTRTLALPYTPGDTALGCNAATNFGKPTGADGAVLVTPTSGTDPFLLTFSSQSGAVVSGVSDAHGWGAPSSVAAVGSTVQEVAWMAGHPLRVARRILASTGNGTNGADDVYPAAWGFGLPAAYIDTVGINLWAGLTDPRSGTHSVRIVSTTPQDGLSWLEGRLSAYGMWLTMRQGQVTGRGAVDYGGSRPPLVMTLDRSRILRGEPVRSLYDSGSSAEYARTATRYGTVSPTTVESALTLPDTRPAHGSYLTDYGDELYQNQANIAARLNQRLGAYRERIPVSVDVSCRLDAAQLCPGDWVLLKHRGVWTQDDLDGGPTVAMVAEVSVDWSAGVVTLTLYIQPGIHRLY